MLKKFHIISVNSTDAQYATLIIGCGADFIAAHDKSQDEIRTLLKCIPETEDDILCTFCDDFFAKDNSNVLAMQSIRPGMKYLSATQLATAIFNNFVPSPVDEPPVTKMTSSQRQQTQNSQSQVLSRASKIVVKIEKSSKSSSSSMPPPMPKHDNVKIEQRSPQRKKICSKTIPEVPIVLSFAASTSPIPCVKTDILAAKVADKVPMIQKSMDLCDTFEASETQLLPRQLNSPIQQEIITEKSSESFDDIVDDSISHGNDIQSRHSVVDDSDWIDAVGGSDREELLRFKRKTFKNESDDTPSDRNDSQLLITRTEAEFVLRNLIVATSARMQTAPTGGRKRDVRCFRKNLVRVVDPGNVLSAAYMESVLPKETEREIQLRLEAAAEDSREEYAEQMFVDRCEKILRCHDVRIMTRRMTIMIILNDS